MRLTGVSAAMVAVLVLAGCAIDVATAPPMPAPGGIAQPRLPTPEQAARNFSTVVERVRPVAEQECRRRSPDLNCNFVIRVDPDPRQPPNAYQSRATDGRPVLTFTVAMVGDVANEDELAFVMGHEAAHHIAHHLDRQQVNASLGAEIFGGLASLTGGGSQAVETAARLGAGIGARSYSKDFELEADRLGTIITWRAGYDPLVGAEYFSRISDPGDRFLGTHPPNSARVDIVRRTVAELKR